MLLHLAVANLGVIQAAEINPSDGLTVITGETGTGKTLLLGGIRQLLGEAGASGLVGPNADQVTIDGLFDWEGEEIGVTRVVPREGRSRTRIDGSVVSAAKARDRLGAMVDVVGQHDQVALKRPDQLRRIIDTVLQMDDPDVLNRYDEAWATYRELVRRQEALGGDLTLLTRELDLARHQAVEIARAGLTPNLDDEIEHRVSRLRNVEEIRENLGGVVDLVERVNDLTGEIVARLRKVSEYDPELSRLTESGESLAAVATDLASESRNSLDGQEADPRTLDELETRLNTIGDLKRKYGRTIEEVLAFGVEIQGRADELEALLNEASSIEEKVREAQSTLIREGANLSRAREEAGKRLIERMLRHLGELGMASARLDISLTPVDHSSTGADRVELMFASDSRISPQPVGDVASGGELSRLVLAIRLASSHGSTTTLVFDEIDAGIGGQTATAMGDKLVALSETTQILCVTHLPQVAARAHRHYDVSRGDSGMATVREVVGEERVDVIATMMSGAETDSGRVAAKELLGSDSK